MAIVAGLRDPAKRHRGTCLSYKFSGLECKPL